MTVVRCPRCRDEVTVPSQAAPEALVRCPLCHEQYLLSVALAQVPPALLIVGSEPAALAPGPEPQTDEYRLASGTAGGVFQPAEPGEHRVSRPALRTGPRARREQKNPLAEVVKVVLGGVVGLSLGLLVLWWGFRRDPLDLGPTFARYVPWLVPASFHGTSSSRPPASRSPGPPPAVASRPAEPREPRPAEAAERPSQTRSESTRKTTESPQRPRRAAPPDSAEPATKSPPLVTNLDPLTPPEPKRPKADVVLDDVKIDDPLALAAPPPKTAAPPASKTDDGKPSEPASREPAAEPATEPSADAVAVADVPAMPDLRDLLPDGPAAEAPASDAPQPTADAFSTVVSAAAAALARYDELPKDDVAGRQKAFTQLFEAASAMGRLAALVPLDEPVVAAPRAEMLHLLQQLSGQSGPSRMTAIKFLAAQQWPERKHDQGLVVAGKIEAIKPAGTLWQVTLQVNARMDQVTVPVLLRSEPKEFQPGDEVLLVGRVVEQPRDRLEGYEGDASRVLLFGAAVKPPP